MDRTFYTATAAGEWPPGIHWSAGETRALPPGWPVPAERPEWLQIEAAGVIPVSRPAKPTRGTP